MSQKKHKKRNSSANPASKDPRKLQQTSSSKRMDPLARNLLCIDLVLLAASQMMLDNGMISNTIADLAGVAGVIMLIAALVLQFGPRNRTPGGPKL